jgi:hypothetical protein
MWPVYQGRSSSPHPRCHASPGAVLARPILPPPPFTQLSLACDVIYLSIDKIPAPFCTTSQCSRPRGPKGAHLKEETKMNNFHLHSSLIGVLGTEQSAPKDRRKFPEFRRTQEF